MRFRSIALAGLLVYALAQESPPSISRTTDKPVSSPAITSLSTVSLFLPMGAPSRVQASVISASPNETVYALGCMGNATMSNCGYTKPITVTEGESTIIFTNTYGGEETSMTASPLTVQCELVGAHLDQIPIHGATSAVCTSTSTIPGLGIGVSTSTLASTEINYMPVTITAGVEKIVAAATMTQGPASMTSNAAASAGTALANFGLCGALGLIAFGVL